MLLVVFRRLTVFVVAASCAIATTAGACRKPAPEAAERTQRTTACAILREPDVEEVFGADVSAPTATNDAGADALAGRSGCAWTTLDQRKAVLIELVRTRDMSSTVRRTGFSADARFAAARSRHATALHVPELGGDALWVDETATMHVLADESYLTFEVAVPVPAEAMTTATALARKAVGRLERANSQHQ